MFRYQFRVSGIIFGFYLLVLLKKGFGNEFRIAGLGFRVSFAGTPEEGFRVRVSDFGYRVSGLCFGIRGCGVGVRVGGLGFVVRAYSRNLGEGFQVRGWIVGLRCRVEGMGFGVEG